MSTESKALTAFTLRELRLCVHANQLTQGTATARFFTLISRLGDGLFWYALMLSLPLVFGWSGIPAGAHICVTALVCALLYWTLKGAIRRPRPYRQDGTIQLKVPPLDEFSFPSGHTLQAVAMTIVAMGWFPVLGWVLIPFTVLVAVSRVVLGLHYPSDVFAAALIGTVIGVASLVLFSV